MIAQPQLGESSPDTLCECNKLKHAHYQSECYDQPGAAQVLDAMVHEVKCWPEFFAAIQDGRKTFEVRADDRGYQVGDYLWEREFDPVDYKNGGRGYTGNKLKVVIGYIGRNIAGVASNVVVMSIKLVAPIVKA